MSGNFITITAGYQHNDIHCEVFLSGQLMCFLQAAGSQQLQLIPKIRETCCGKYICNNVCFGMTTLNHGSLAAANRGVAEYELSE
ncbi:hypothetical protein P5Y81_004655 [Escherichia coli]|nr:hypothetical protein [Salmonella enterica subsp. enterica serovar Typhimurium]EKQ5610694.1 hypothetical protein [Escherichia coli]